MEVLGRVEVFRLKRLWGVGGYMADLLWDVPQTNSAILCRRQKHVSGRMCSQAPDRSVHVSVHQDVARCIFLSYFDDLCIPGPHEDFTLTQQQAKRVKI